MVQLRCIHHEQGRGTPCAHCTAQILQRQGVKAHHRIHCILRCSIADSRVDSELKGCAPLGGLVQQWLTISFAVRIFLVPAGDRASQ